jgi:hypothetical protein
MTEVKVQAIAFDTISNAPVVLLQELSGDRVLPIWIGPFEAMSIAMAIEKINIERPLTHDLTKMIIEGLGAKVTKVMIHEIIDGTFYARLYMKRLNSIVEIDSRPSDSIAIAIRAKAPIFVTKKIMEGNAAFTLEEGSTLKKHLKNLKPEAFGKYRMQS